MQNPKNESQRILRFDICSLKHARKIETVGGGNIRNLHQYQKSVNNSQKRDGISAKNSYIF